MENIATIREEATSCIEKQASKMMATSLSKLDVAKVGMTVSD